MVRNEILLASLLVDLCYGITTEDELHNTTYSLEQSTTKSFEDRPHLDIFKNSKLTEENQEILNYLSRGFCFLSFCAIFAIFLTALVFSSWRKKLGTTFILHLSGAILFEVILLYVAHYSSDFNISLSRDGCIIIGMALQYVVFSKLSWMFITGTRHLHEYVKVFTPPPARIFLNSIIIGWGLPAIPVTLIVLLNTDNYTSTTHGFCYPKGATLYLGVLLPLVIVIWENIRILYTIISKVFAPSGNEVQHFINDGGNMDTEETSQTKAEHENSTDTAVFKLKRAIFLFFVIGLPWTFEVLAEFFPPDTLLYSFFNSLFSITAPIQGLLLFISFIVIDKTARNMWYNYAFRQKNEKPNEIEECNEDERKTTLLLYENDKETLALDVAKVENEKN